MNQYAHIAPDDLPSHPQLAVISCGYQDDRAHPACRRPHGRADTHLLVVASGCLHVRSGGAETVLYSGGIVLYRPGEPQYYRRSAEPVGATYWVHFTGDAVPVLLHRLGLDDLHTLQLDPNLAVPAGFDRMIREMQRQKPHYLTAAAAELAGLLAQIARSRTEMQQLQSPIDAQILEIAAQMKTQLSRPMSVESCAQACGLCRYRFIEHFKRLTGQTPLQYRTALRMDHAKFLLRATDCTMAEITQEIGLESVPYFTRLFHRVTGQTPSAFRAAGGRHKTS